MSKKEFQLIRSCLHPDRHNNDPKYQEAFAIFNRMLETIDANLYKSWSK
jgi:hypothetical protein